MPLVWTPVATTLLVLSSGASLLTMLHLRLRWDVHASSVRYLFWLFFTYIFGWCSMRAVFFVWLSSHTPSDLVQSQTTASSSKDHDDHDQWTYGQLDRLGIHGILCLNDSITWGLVAVIVAGDVALLGIALTLFPLTYELGRLARISMDRGVLKESRQTQRYCVVIASVLVAYTVTQLVLTIVYDGYNVYTHRCLLAVYGLQFIGLAYMASQLVRLKMSGRKFETIHGTFVASPVYQRLKRIMLVYGFFAFQFQLSMVIIYFYDITPNGRVFDAAGVSALIYNASGLALSITTSCSQACVFSACAPCLPEDCEAQFLHERFGGTTAPLAEDLEAPKLQPVFVYTDIESSSALWNANGEIMSEAIEIHDTILRSSLLKHRGYEITTVGDAFQIAFHSEMDAIEYCMDVQLQLMVAKWPKGIHGAVPSTAKLRAGRKVIFNGLRVRMGIHDALDTEGMLIQDVHAVTGKTTYTGVSEVIAEYVGDLGCGGQILMTGRIASWLKYHRDDLSVDVFVEYMGEFTVPQVQAMVAIYQVLPMMLADRRQHFKPLVHRDYLPTIDTAAQSRRRLLSQQSGSPARSSSTSTMRESLVMEMPASPVESPRSEHASPVQEKRQEKLVPKVLYTPLLSVERRTGDFATLA